MKTVVGFLTGIIIGGTAALLLAPESGEKTREKLKERGEQLRKDIEDQAKQSKEKLEDLRQKSAEKFDEIKESSQEAMEEAAKRLNSQDAPRPVLDKS